MVVLGIKDLIKMIKTKTKKSISIASRKAKARTAQNWVAKQISELLDIPWGVDTSIEPRRMGQPGVDIRLDEITKPLFNWSLEVKNSEVWNLPAAIKQVKENQMEETDWLVILKKNNHEYVAVLSAEVFFDLLKLIPNQKKGRNLK